MVVLFIIFTYYQIFSHVGDLLQHEKGLGYSLETEANLCVCH